MKKELKLLLNKCEQLSEHHKLRILSMDFDTKDRFSFYRGYVHCLFLSDELTLKEFNLLLSLSDKYKEKCL